MSDPIEEALTFLRQRAAELDDERSRVADAITNLEQYLPGGSSRPSRAPSSHDPNRPSVRTMVVSLLEEADRDWSASEILTEYRRRGTPVHGVDPSNALRAALADAKKRGMIVSTGVGRYRSARFTKSAAEAAEPPAAETEPRYSPPSFFVRGEEVSAS